MVEMNKLERSLSTGLTTSPLETLSQHAASVVNPENPQAVQTEFRALFQKAFQEEVGGVAHAKPNSLAFQLRGLEMQGAFGKLTLQEALSQAWIGGVDIANLKKINEDHSLQGHSYETGNAVLNLHARSLQEADFGPDTITILVRPQGDEILTLIIPLSTKLNLAQIDTAIKTKTNELIDQALMNTDPDDPNYGLHLLASNHREVIDKVMHFTKLDNATLPQGHYRMDDVVEFLMAEIEKVDPLPTMYPQNFSASKQILHSIKNQISDIDLPLPAENGTAAETLLKAVEQTTTVTEHEKSPEVLASRWQNIEDYLPPSLQSKYSYLKEVAGADPDRQATVILGFEEAIFNMQFGRNPPMLNNWAFNELVLTDTSDMPHRFTKLGMVSTFFVKLINSTQGRLAGTRILRHLAKTITTSIKTEPGKYAPVLISKVGGSFYLALREDSAQDFSHNLAGKLNRTFQTVKFLSRKEPHEDYDSGTFKQFLFRLATRLPIYTTQAIYSATRPSGRTLSELGNTYDTLRHTQYLEETAIAHRYYQYYLDKHPEISTLWQAFLAERPERRHQDLLFIDPETTPIFGEFIRQYFGEFAPLPQPN